MLSTNSTRRRPARRRGAGATGARATSRAAARQKRSGRAGHRATAIAASVMVVLMVAVGGIVWAGNVLSSPHAPQTVRSLHLTADNLTSAQSTNAQTIIGVGKTAKVGEDGIVVALMTALQESTLYNLDHGDRDSRGLFQQRPSQQWGTDEQVQDPVYSARAFYGINPQCPNVGLKQVKGWKTMKKNDAAQTVQASGYPEAYAKWEQTAYDILSKYGDSPAI
ncbi:peptidoglycan-binding protein [Brevibacterium sp. 91QC2O2]|uniref:peptidoglycan-binding protein n=1 Tax=Brevibacterium sp. 91QC2O2 TaxID=2968458 RepID=UPI00211BD9E6|nr:peptidoglycan-binding protein [Brevibacterium sp. 91QC2O2]MCQ9368002.1 peptidoglycan-binding protein [Brevibacterium sp. 91QC2O2]